MHRTQISLENWQYEKLKEVSRREKRSLSSVIRDLVSGILSSEVASKEEDSLTGLIGIGRGDRLPVAREHDKYLYAKDK